MNPLAPLIDWTDWERFVNHGPGAFLDAEQLAALERDRARLARELEDWRIQKGEGGR